MSVPKGDRNETKVEFYNNLYKVQDILMNLLLTDFGLRINSRDLKAFTYKAKMSKDDAETFKNLCEQYNINVECSVPLWFIEYFRDIILEDLKNISLKITQANSIYPNTNYQWDLRLSYSDEAIATCYDLLATLEFLMRVFPGQKEKDVNKFLQIAKFIKNEIKSLKRWIKSDRSKRKKLEEKAAKAAADKPVDVSPTYTNSSNTNDAFIKNARTPQVTQADFVRIVEEPTERQRHNAINPIRFGYKQEAICPIKFNAPTGPVCPIEPVKVIRSPIIFNKQ